MSYVVSLNSNGDYWQAAWTDDAGRRQRHGLGRKSKTSKRQANVMCRRIEADLNAGRMQAGDTAPKLGPFLERYLTSRTDLKPRTKRLHEMTCRYLRAFFGDSIRIDKIMPSAARDWETAISQGKLKETRKWKRKRPETTCSPATVSMHVRNARTIFGRAVEEELLHRNPFKVCRATAPAPAKDWHYVSREQLDDVLEACPDTSWRVFIALLRLAGLRRGEALSLRLRDVEFADPMRLRVWSEKTNRGRVVPVEPALQLLLIQAHAEAPEGAEFVVGESVARSSVRKRFQTILKRAGIEEWADLFQVMRRNCETDWAQTYPQHAVSEWLGHDISVSARHYLQVPLELYEKVSQSATETATKQDADQASSRKSLDSRKRVTGIEPATFSLGS